MQKPAISSPSDHLRLAELKIVDAGTLGAIADLVPRKLLQIYNFLPH